MNIFGIHWAIHLTYLMAIIGGLFIGNHNLHGDRFLESQVAEVQPWSQMLIEHSNQDKWVDINQAFLTPGNEAHRRSARSATEMVRLFSGKCHLAHPWLKEMPTDSLLRSLVDHYALLGDSLKQVFPPDTDVQNWVNDCLYQDYSSAELYDWLRKGDSTEVTQLLHNLELKSTLALHAGLTTLQTKIEKQKTYFDALLPIITYEQCPRAGQPFYAALQMATYNFPLIAADNFKMRVNGKFIPVEKGLGHYRATDSKPMQVDILIKNPLTGGIKTYSKEFRR